MKKILAALLVVCLCVIPFTGCRRAGVTIDDTKTQLYIANYDGGVGTDWLNEAAERFSAAYESESFESGKTGVQIVIEPQKTFKGTSYFSTIRNMPYDLFFAESIYYNDLVAQGGVYDMTEIVQSVISEAEPVTIESKIDVQQREFLTALTDGKYYALPHYEMYNGLMYDIELFEDFGFYLADSSVNPADTQDGFIANNKTLKRSPGPDGQPRTDDDGLPATYDEFYRLCDFMVRRGVYPLGYSGEYPFYSSYLLEGLYLNSTGADEVMLNFDFDGGETDIITGFNGDEPVIERVRITEENGYLLRQQVGKYYALVFLETILRKAPESSTPYFAPGTFTETYTHTDLQEDFLKNYYDGTPIAMIAEGSYWYNEAKSAVADLNATNPGETATHRLGLMPLPRYDGGAVDVTLSSQYNAYCFANGTIASDPAKVRVVTEFVKFLYSDAELKAFTISTGVAKGVNYVMESTDVAQMTPFAQQVWELKQSADIVNPNNDNALFLNNQSTISLSHEILWQSSVSGTPYSVPVTAFRSGVTAKEYFLGMWMDETTWDGRYRQWFTTSD